MSVHCAGCSTTAGIAGCPEHGSKTYTPPPIGVNDFITTCRHGVDLRFTPRCYLCSPAERDETIWWVTPSGHGHKGKWCEMCVAHGRTPPDGYTLVPVGLREAAQAYLDNDGSNGTYDARQMIEARERLRAALEAAR